MEGMIDKEKLPAGESDMNKDKTGISNCVWKNQRIKCSKLTELILKN